MATFKLERLKLVGAGAITRHHVAAARELNPSVALEVWDPSPAARENFKKEFPTSTVHDREESFWNVPAGQGDILAVCTPPFAHGNPVRRGLESGHPVLCEKPLALDLAEARSLVELSEAKGLPMACCSSRFIGGEATERVKAMVRSGELGRLRQLAWIHRSLRSRSGIEYQPGSRWFLDKSKSGGGPLFDWGIYDLATIWHLLEPESVTVASAWIEKTATSADPKDGVYDVETGGGASFVFKSPSYGSVQVNYERAGATHGPEITRRELAGDRGAVSWDWLSFDGTCRMERFFDDGHGPKSTATEAKESCPVSCHHRPLRHLLEALDTGSSSGMVGRKILGPLALTRALYRVSETGVAETVRIEGS